MLAERGDGVHQQQGGVAGGVDRRAHLVDAAGAAGRGLVVDDADGLDAVCRGRSARASPMAAASAPRRQSVSTKSGSRPRLSAISFHRVANQPVRHISTRVAGRERVDEGGLPGAGAGGGVDDDRAGGAEDALEAGEHLPAERAELGAAMVDRRVVDRAQHPVRHVGRAGDLEEMPPGAVARRVACGRHSPFNRPFGGNAIGTRPADNQQAIAFKSSGRAPSHRGPNARAPRPRRRVPAPQAFRRCCGAPGGARRRGRGKCSGGGARNRSAPPLYRPRAGGRWRPSPARPGRARPAPR